MYRTESDFNNEQEGVLCWGWGGIWHKKTGDNKKKSDIRVKIDKQGGKGVKQSAKGTKQ